MIYIQMRAKFRRRIQRMSKRIQCVRPLPG